MFINIENDEIDEICLSSTHNFSAYKVEWFEIVLAVGSSGDRGQVPVTLSYIRKINPRLRPVRRSN